ncbi:carbohydrate ABC transporter permease [uncultured Phycicoccus sp.]|uniref:carbohydrate ABC transporter permease n=1 Tax=uncultured Phycicoccus sp. TaxID=661422 RepID=UPI002633E34C|nr:carbohydrate ABC transporter permease [uncultured Phycicoccus sp.]
MTTSNPGIPVEPSVEQKRPSGPRKLTKAEIRASEAKTRLTSPWATGIAIIMAILWTIPTFGLLITSIRPQASIQQSGWWTWFTNPEFTLQNYETVLTGSSTAFGTYFVNTLVITIPAVVIPITIALLAAYAFAWIEFRGRDLLFVAVFALQIVPLQVTLIPLLSIYVDVGLAGSFWTVWLSHSIFALPLAIFMFHNFMKDIPRSLVEAARVDGAGHVRIFFRVLLPLLVPAVAAFTVFQFLWVWNDLLVALTFAGGTPNVAPLTVRLAELSGSRGQDWHLLSAGAFVALIVPVLIFLFGQRYFVRGLLAGGVKG